MTNGWIIGVDEAGRGPCGPSCCRRGCPARTYRRIGGFKKLSARKRALLEAQIMEQAHWAYAEVGVEEIDRFNIFGATMVAMTRAVEALVARLEGRSRWC
jgi:ribonuclease HII